MPSTVRNFLETADRFEVFAQLTIQDGKLSPAMSREFAPNFKAVVTDTEKRKNLLRTFYLEAARGDAPAICYLPSHSIVAHKGDREVKVEICFGCNRFYVSGYLGKSEGTFSDRRGGIEQIVSTLITESGVTTK